MNRCGQNLEVWKRRSSPERDEINSGSVQSGRKRPAMLQDKFTSARGLVGEASRGACRVVERGQKMSMYVDQAGDTPDPSRNAAATTKSDAGRQELALFLLLLTLLSLGGRQGGLRLQGARRALLTAGSES